MKLKMLPLFSLLFLSINLNSSLAIDLDKIRTTEVKNITIEKIKGKITKKNFFQYLKSTMTQPTSLFYINAECNYIDSKSHNIKCEFYNTTYSQGLDKSRKPGFLTVDMDKIINQILINEYGYKVTYEVFESDNFSNLHKYLLKYYAIIFSGCKTVQNDGRPAGSLEIDKIQQVTNELKKECFAIEPNNYNHDLNFNKNWMDKWGRNAPFESLQALLNNHEGQLEKSICFTKEKFEEKLIELKLTDLQKKFVMENSIRKDKAYGEALYKLANDMSNFFESTIRESLKKGELKREPKYCDLVSY